MGRRENRVYQQNARRGAITRWCPRCKRKAALSSVHGMVFAVHGQVTGTLYRRCRYCGLEVKMAGKNIAARRRLYERWTTARQQGK